MKFVIDNWSLILVALVSGVLLLFPSLMRGARGGGLAPNAAVQLINREKGVVVDVSEPEEFAAGHVVGARNVPLGQLEERLPQAVKNKALPLILVDPKGPRSHRALGVAKKLGYQQAHVLAGGLAAWKEANLPVEKA